MISSATSPCSTRTRTSSSRRSSSSASPRATPRWPLLAAAHLPLLAAAAHLPLLVAAAHLPLLADRRAAAETAVEGTVSSSATAAASLASRQWKLPTAPRNVLRLARLRAAAASEAHSRLPPSTSSSSSAASTAACTSSFLGSAICSRLLSTSGSAQRRSPSTEASRARSATTMDPVPSGLAYTWFTTERLACLSSATPACMAGAAAFHLASPRSTGASSTSKSQTSRSRVKTQKQKINLLILCFS